MPRRSLLGFQRGCCKHFHDSHAFIYGLNMGIDAIYSMLSFALGKAAGALLYSRHFAAALLYRDKRRYSCPAHCRSVDFNLYAHSWGKT